MGRARKITPDNAMMDLSRLCLNSRQYVDNFVNALEDDKKVDPRDLSARGQNTKKRTRLHDPGSRGKAGKVRVLDENGTVQAILSERGKRVEWCTQQYADKHGIERIEDSPDLSEFSYKSDKSTQTVPKPTKQDAMQNLRDAGVSEDRVKAIEAAMSVNSGTWVDEDK